MRRAKRRRRSAPIASISSTYRISPISLIFHWTRASVASPQTAGTSIILDTNIFVDHLRNFPPAVKYVEALGVETVFFSAITEAELLAGRHNNNPKKREKLLQLLLQWTKVPVTNPVAVLAGDFSRQYCMQIPDALIAATAVLNNAELITKNVKDFQKVEKLRVKEPY